MRHAIRFAATDQEKPVTCPTCRDDLGLPALGVG
jgi:hypothetical protein